LGGEQSAFAAAFYVFESTNLGTQNLALSALFDTLLPYFPLHKNYMKYFVATATHCHINIAFIGR
jgi:hypothetical protein